MSRLNGPVVAIDGTAGTGKSSVGRAAAQQMGYGFLSTGAMYRALAYEVYAARVNPADEQAVLQVAQNLQFHFERQSDATLKMFVDGEYLGNKLTLDEVAQTASKVSTHARARAVLTEKMRQVGRDGGIILEGRDIGTVVFPDAEVKIYLTAAPQVRAQRRVQQLLAQGAAADYEQILASIKDRDQRDMTRTTAPLKPAADAVQIDTSAMTMPQVIAAVVKEINKYAA